MGLGRIFWWNYGAGSTGGSSVPPATPALAVSDNGDGSGGVATVAGSTGGSTNTVYYSPYAGVQGVLTWQAAGTLSGDGTLAVSPGTGLYFWYCLSQTAGGTAAAPPVFQALTDQTQGVHYRCLLALQTRIRGLGLAGLSAAQVQVKWLPRFWEQVDATPLVCIAPVGREGQPGVLTGRDDIVYPCVVAVVDKSNQGYTQNLARNLLWRQQIFRAVRHQRLAGVPEVITTSVTPDYVIDPALWNRNLYYSALLVNPTSREPRGS